MLCMVGCALGGRAALAGLCVESSSKEFCIGCQPQLWLAGACSMCVASCELACCCGCARCCVMILVWGLRAGAALVLRAGALLSPNRARVSVSGCIDWLLSLGAVL